MPRSVVEFRRVACDVLWRAVGVTLLRPRLAVEQTLRYWLSPQVVLRRTWPFHIAVKRRYLTGPLKPGHRRGQPKQLRNEDLLLGNVKGIAEQVHRVQLLQPSQLLADAADGGFTTFISIIRC
jgi:hypothetical protein